MSALEKAKAILKEQGGAKLLQRIVFYAGRQLRGTAFAGLSYLPLKYQLIDLIYKALRIIDPEHYTDARATKLIWIDPNDIIKRSSLGRPTNRNQVVAGDWDLKTTPVESRPVNRAIKKYIKDGVSWEATDLKNYFSGKVQHSKNWFYNSPDQFEERCQDIECVIESISKKGYKLKSQVDTDASSNDPIPVFLDEVSVDIARNGEILWRDFGEHRLAIAQALGVDKIPVHVITRHRLWQEVRVHLRRVRSADGVARKYQPYIGHPDLMDLPVRDENKT